MRWSSGASPGWGRRACSASLPAAVMRSATSCSPGSAAELEADLPFWVFVDALDEYLQALEQRRLDALGPETLADLAGVFPSLQSAADGATAGGDRYRMHRAVRQLLETLAATEPWCSCSTTCTGRTTPRSSARLPAPSSTRRAGSARRCPAPPPAGRGVRRSARARSRRGRGHEAGARGAERGRGAAAAQLGRDRS